MYQSPKGSDQNVTIAFPLLFYYTNGLVLCRRSTIFFSDLDLRIRDFESDPGGQLITDPKEHGSGSYMNMFVSIEKKYLVIKGTGTAVNPLNKLNIEFFRKFL